MGYGLSGEALRKALNEVRWTFDKAKEYPDLVLHPNLVIEDAIDELARLEPQVPPKMVRKS